MRFRQSLSDWGYWLAAIVVALAPAVLALDFGGVLPWTKHVSALALASACLITFLSRLVSIGCPTEVRLRPKCFAVSGMLLALTLYVLLQTVPLPPELVARLSPASHAAWTDWAGELIEIAPRQWLPISIAPFDSRHAIAVLVIAVMVSFFSVIIYQSRARMTMLLSALAFGACSVALIGLARKLFPGFQLWSFQDGGEGAPFGTFLNRNNAALTINLGIGSAVGLLLWRRAAVTSAGIESFHRNTSVRSSRSRRESTRSRESDLRWLRDPVVLSALLGMTICLLGLVVCGSRGGLLSMVLAGAATLYVMRRSLGRLAGVFAGTALLAFIVLLVLRSDRVGSQAIQGDTIAQLESTMHSGGDRLSTDTRLAHWPDGMRTALKHFPAGSGLASYGFAYLPWQKTSPWRLCLHADNLWLEMLVELGLVGLALAVAMAWLIVSSLLRLRRSADPLDQGLFATGLYLSVVILISQTFDFGLIVPANLIAVVGLISIVVARAAAVVIAKQNEVQAGGGGTGRPKLVLLSHADRWWKSQKFTREQLPQCLVGCFLLAIGIPAIDRLRLDTHADFLVRTAEGDSERFRFDEQQLDAAAEELKRFVQKHAHPDVSDALVKLEFQRGRLRELATFNFGRLPEPRQIEIYSATSRSNRRLAWRKSRGEFSANVSRSGQPVPALPLAPEFRSDTSPYSLALHATRKSLRRRPLALEPRLNLAYLEFVEPTADKTETAIKQAASLFRNTPELQLRFGLMAANQGDYQTAATIWRRAATLDQGMMRRVLARAVRLEGFPVRQLVPDSPSARQAADTFLESVGYQD